MKRLTTALALLLALLTLAACGTPHGNTGPVTTPVQIPEFTTPTLSEETAAPGEETTAYPLLITDPLPNFTTTLHNVIENNTYDKYNEFNALSTPAFTVPGLDQKIVPQGMDIWREQGWIMMSGYFSDSSVSDCSMVIAIDMTTGEIAAEYKLKNIDGSNHTGHAGGVAITKKNMFISTGSQLLRVPLEQLYEAGRQGDARIVEEIRVPVRASFCNYSGGYLWVGDFYYGKSYPTDQYRHMKNSEGKMYYAWSVGYALDSSAENEIGETRWQDSMEYATPDVILSIDQKIQGMAVVDGEHIALSQSYGRGNDSKIMIYKNVLSTPPHTAVTLNGSNIPLWFLDGNTELDVIDAPPMSEGLAAVNGALYILFESGAEKYRLDGGKRPTDQIWVMEMPRQ